MIPYISFVGYGNSGKTTLIINLIQEFKQIGLNVATIKHASHGYQLDTKGKDSYKVFEAGACKTMVVGKDSYTLHSHFSSLPPLNELLEKINDPNIDLVLVEGFKFAKSPKIEVYRSMGRINHTHISKEELDKSEKRLDLEDIVAVVSDIPLETSLPLFSFNKIKPLANFIIKYLKLRQN